MAKNVPDSVKKTAKDFFGHFVKRPIKPLGKLVRTQKNRFQNFFSLGATRVPNSAKLGRLGGFGPNFEQK